VKKNGLRQQKFEETMRIIDEQANNMGGAAGAKTVDHDQQDKKPTEAQTSTNVTLHHKQLFGIHTTKPHSAQQNAINKAT
jgi:hypothetical protein